MVHWTFELKTPLGYAKANGNFLTPAQANSIETQQYIIIIIKLKIRNVI
jgi:hypothetical protein